MPAPRPSRHYLVTGGAGLIGSHLCDALVARGDRVTCVDDLRSGTRDNLAHAAASGRFTYIEGDVAALGDVDVDAIFNLACPASPTFYQRDPVGTLETCVLGAMRVFALARRRQLSVVHASTSEVYGDPEVHPQPETYWGNVNPIGPRGVYDEAKRYAEALTMAYHRQQGVDTSIVRIFNTYGPKMRPNDGRAIPNFLSQALAEKPLTIYGDGSQTRSFCYVDDLIRGLVLLAESGEHLPVNVGNPGEYTILQLAEAILAATGSPSQILYEALPVDDPQVRQPDITRARQILGWQPEIELDEGLRRTLASLERDSTRA